MGYHTDQPAKHVLHGDENLQSAHINWHTSTPVDTSKEFSTAYNAPYKAIVLNLNSPAFMP